MGRGVDYLTCGRCLKEFQLQDIIDFIQHKKVDCDESEKEQDASIKHLYCSSCSKVFLSAWSLLKHAQFSHKFPLFHNVDNDAPTSELKPSSVLYKNKARDRKSGKEEVLLPMDPHCNWEGDGTDGSTDCEYLNRKDYRMTVIPRIPEKPKKCCNAVIPKKRKHHMETKHVSSVESSRNQKRKGLPELSTSYQNEIYIDLEPGNQNMAAPTDREEDKNELFSYSTCSSHSENSTLNRMVSNTNDMNKNKSRSFIIHPRSVFSIPFSCTIVSEPATSSVTSVPMSSVHSVDSATIVSCRSGSRTTQASTQQLSPASAQQNVPQPAAPPNPTIPGNHAQQGPDGVSEPLSQSSGNFGDGNNPFSGRQGRKRKYPTSRPFKCDLCDNAFNQRIHLKKHLSKHTGVKPYKCHQCDYSTVERSHLKVHIRIHTGEKPFKCTFCEYATAQNSTLKIHLKRHHSGRMFKCKCCGKSFTQKNLLKSHEVNHHSQHQQPLVLDNSNSPSPQPLTGTNNNC